MVALVAVKLVKKAVTEFSKLAKKLVDVALVVVEFEALKLVVNMFAALVVPVRVRLFREEMVVVAITPLTFRVRRFVAVAYERFVVVVAAISEASEVVATTPLTVVVMTPVLVAYETVFPVMIDEVAETPLIVVVKTLPREDCVKVSIIFTIAEETPFTIVVKVFVEVETEFVITTVAVAVLVAKTILPF
jgi:hypothetical protein